MTTNNDQPRKTQLTRHAYEIVHANISESDGNIRRNIGNAKSFGTNIDDPNLPESIRNFTHWVRRRYRKKRENVNYTQLYLVYGLYLYIFTHNKSKLITAIHLPEHTHEDARELTLSKNVAKRRRLEKKKHDALSAPLRRTWEDPAKKKAKKKKKKKKV